MPDRPPNIILIVTDQQRQAQHWPEDPEWLDRLTPADAELRRTGVTFTHAFTATSMCSPSRATFFTGAYPSRHGVRLTMTEGDLHPNPRNIPDVLRTLWGLARNGEVPRRRLGKAFLRGLLRTGPRSGDEPELPAGTPTIATLLRERGYEVVLKGKWHLTKPLNGESWSAEDSERIERDFGFAGWEPPDTGGDAKAEHFGGGNAGTTHEGWDEDYTRQVERWLAQQNLPEPFCLIVSLVNPHDVLGYPSSFEEGGYAPSEFRDLEVPLPPTIDEDMSGKPSVHLLMKLGQTAYIGALKTEQAKQDYVDFYAHLHRVVDAQVGRVIGALGSPDDTSSLRSRTVIARFSDHGEMGLSHGGLRQKMFNAYEETIRVPLIISNPVLFPEGSQTPALASLVDLVPTVLGLTGIPAGENDVLDGQDLTSILARHSSPDPAAVEATGVSLDAVTRHEQPMAATRDHILFTYDDHQAATDMQEAPGQPNRIRCVRDQRWKYALYLDPEGQVAPEYEFYDLETDPDEAENLLGKATGSSDDPEIMKQKARMHTLLEKACLESGTTAPALPEMHVS